MPPPDLHIFRTSIGWNVCPQKMPRKNFPKTCGTVLSIHVGSLPNFHRAPENRITRYGTPAAGHQALLCNGRVFDPEATWERTGAEWYGFLQKHFHRGKSWSQFLQTWYYPNVKHTHTSPLSRRRFGYAPLWESKTNLCAVTDTFECGIIRRSWDNTVGSWKTCARRPRNCSREYMLGYWPSWMCCISRCSPSLHLGLRSGYRL